MALSDDGAVLYVGYYYERYVIAYDVATLQLKWKATIVNPPVTSIAYHEGMLLVAPQEAPITVLNAEDGSVVRTLGDVDGSAWGISVFAGLGCVTAVASLHTPPCRSAILESQVQRLAQQWSLKAACAVSDVFITRVSHVLHVNSPCPASRAAHNLCDTRNKQTRNKRSGNTHFRLAPPIATGSTWRHSTHYTSMDHVASRLARCLTARSWLRCLSDTRSSTARPETT